MKTRAFIAAGFAVRARTMTTTPHRIFRRTWLWTGFVAFAAIAFGPQSAQAAVTEAWVQRYGSETGSQDYAYKVVTDAAGNVIVAGSTGNQIGTGFDMLVIKYSGAGLPLWTNRYNGTANSVATAVAVDGSGNVFVTGNSATIAYSGAGVPLWTNRNNGGYATAVAVDGGGNVFVTGYSVGSGGNEDYATIAYTSAGLPLWTNRYNGSGNGWASASAVAVDGSGNVFVTGSSSFDGRDSDFATMAYSSAGMPLWTNRYNNGYDVAKAVAVDGSGNVFVTGWSSYSSGGGDYVTIAYSSAGVRLWTKRYNGSATAVAVDGDGNVVVTGSSDSDYATMKYSGAGVPLWTNRYDGPANSSNSALFSSDQATAVAVDASGNVFVTGGSGPYFSGGGSDFATIAYSGAGVALWTNRYSGRGDAWDAATAMAVDGSGHVFVTGSSYVSGGFHYEYATIAYSGAGLPLWTNRYNGTTNSYYNKATAVAVDGSGNVFVTGSSDGIQGYDYATIAYSGAGLPLWTNRYNGPANGDDQASALAVDGSGNVFVTGSSYGNGDNIDYATIAYSGAGLPLWTNRYNGPANSDWREVDVATAVAVDGRGNVVVTGHSNGDYYTAKYSGADGSVLWQQRYNGPGNFYDHATAVAVDGSGNVFVTGYSVGSGGDTDYATIAYSGAGVALWTNRYNGPANGNDQATALAVDGSGNVVVTGHLGGPDFNIPEGDYYTAKYAAADGTLLWEKHYNGPANTVASASALAVDGSGNVVVTGRSQDDYYTAKYGAADGALLWEQRFNRFSAGGSSPCLALGPNGMIAVSGSSSGDYATIVYRDVPAVSIDLISTGVRLRVTGVPVRSYNIERAPAVPGPWTTINTQTTPASGLLEYLHTHFPAAAAFYRTSEQSIPPEPVGQLFQNPWRDGGAENPLNR